ncbi:MAG: NAD(P)H-quinone oxidoreductase [Gemmatimonadales bacterium]
MRAIIHSGAGGPDVLQLGEAPTPSPGPEQVRVRVEAAGLNRADILQRRGRYPAPPGWPADIPGLEYAGTVERPGSGVTRWQVGDRVMGLVGGGAHAEYVVVHQDETMAIPAALDFAHAAAIPEAFLTAWDALVIRGKLQRGERVLLHAVGSGVGTAAVQLAQWLGATSIGTSRSADKLRQAQLLGLTEAIDTSTGGDARAYPTVDVIIDVLGGPAFAANLEALAPRGRLVMLGHLQGSRAEVGLEPILRKRLEVIGSVMRTRALTERIPLVRAFVELVLPAFAAAAGGAPPLRPIVGIVCPMTDIVSAHAAMEADSNFGKIVLAW